MHFVTGGLSSLNISHFGLRQPGNPGAYTVSFTVAWHLFQEMTGMLKIIWARTNKAHLTSQHIDDLRQFIKAASAEKSTKGRNPVRLNRAVSRSLDRRGGCHRPKFDRAKPYAVASHTLLHKKQRTRISRWIEYNQNHGHKSDDRQKKKAHPYVENAL